MSTDFSQSLLWFDYETFGNQPRSDRPAQFAAVRTDWNLNEIEPPQQWFCRPAPDYWPDPAACLITRITPAQCAARGLREDEFAQRIHAAFSQPGTIGAGYNSVRFDDEITRFLLWRTLREPYAREWQNGCGRWDLLDVVRMVHALRPESLRWPVREDGSGFTSFKLENLTKINDIAHDQAHDAVSDVRATIALARRIRDANPRLFAFALELRKKERVLQEMGLGSDGANLEHSPPSLLRPTSSKVDLGRGQTPCLTGRPFLHISPMIDAAHGHLAVMFPLIRHPKKPNEIICWDLRADPSELASLSAADIATRVFTRRDQLPEGVARLPIKTIHLNRAPMVVAQLATLRPAEAERWSIDIARARAHSVIAAQLPAMRQDWAELWQAIFAPRAENLKKNQGLEPDVDTALYDGFVPASDRRRIDQWRRLPPEQRAQQPLPAFDDPRLAELSWRWQALNWPETLDPSQQQRWQAHCQQRLLDGSGSGGRSAEQFFAQLDEIAEKITEKPPNDAHEAQALEDLLGELYDWASERAPEF